MEMEVLKTHLSTRRHNGSLHRRTAEELVVPRVVVVKHLKSQLLPFHHLNRKMKLNIAFQDIGGC